MKIDQLKNRLQSFNDVEFSGPVSENAIADAEHELRIKFPPEYRSFLSSFGSGGIESEEFIGLGGESNVDVIFVKNRLTERDNRLPSHLIPLRNDGYGNYDCIDTSQPSENDEFLIVEWRHDGGQTQSPRVLARSYFEWFNSVLDLLESGS